jgi:hypothetical protein
MDPAPKPTDAKVSRADAVRWKRAQRARQAADDVVKIEVFVSRDIAAILDRAATAFGTARALEAKAILSYSAGSFATEAARISARAADCWRRRKTLLPYSSALCVPGAVVRVNDATFTYQDWCQLEEFLRDVFRFFERRGWTRERTTAFLDRLIDRDVTV